MKKFLLPLFLLFSIFLTNMISVNAANMFYLDPQKNWVRDYKATFSNIDITVEPQGLFTSYKFEIEMFNPGSKNLLQTELNWDFNLANDDFMNNAWLWVGDTLVLADVLDKWTASMIYEGIVNRRKDPLLIMKNGTNYNLKLYPFIGEESRKFIIKIMKKNQMVSNEVSLNFPFNTMFLTSSAYNFFDINLIFVGTNTKEAPVMKDTTFKLQKIDESDGVKKFIYSFKPKGSEKPQNIGMNYAINSKNNIFFGISQVSQNEGFFQISANQSMVNIQDSSKFLFLVNYQSDKVTFKKAEVIDELKSYLKTLNGKKFKFNVMTGNYSINSLSDNWISSSDNPNIDSLFKSRDLQLSDISMLPSLLLKSNQFLKDNSSDAKVIVINCSDEFYSPGTSNSFIEKYMLELPNYVPVNIINYQNYNLEVTKINNKYYLGSEYFYEILTKQTGGVYFDCTGLETLNYCIKESLNRIIYSLDMYEFRVVPNNGIAYNTYSATISNQNNTYTSNIQFGKYVGTFPFKIEIVALKDQIPYISNIQINSYDDLVYFNETEQIWYAKYIKDIESSNEVNDNKVMRRLIDLSIDKRILTNFTAFLALEPWMKKQDTLNQNETDKDDNPTDVKDLTALSEISINCSPNPFIDKVNININNLNENEIIQSIQIYDALGNLVHEFELTSKSLKEINLLWHPDKISKGIYIVKVKTDKRVIQSKIINM